MTNIISRDLIYTVSTLMNQIGIIINNLFQVFKPALDNVSSALNEFKKTELQVPTPKPLTSQLSKTTKMPRKRKHHQLAARRKRRAKEREDINQFLRNLVFEKTFKKVWTVAVL